MKLQGSVDKIYSGSTESGSTNKLCFFLRSLVLQGRCWTGNIFKRPEAERWSRLNYPNEKPPRKDFTLWATAIQHIVPADGIMDRLGRFNHEDYKIWPWRYDSVAERLLHRTDEGIEVYGKATQTRTRSSTRWELLADAQPIDFAGKICTV